MGDPLQLDSGERHAAALDALAALERLRDLREGAGNHTPADPDLIDLARRAMQMHLPLLAICRGSQVLNVATGGTLVQDIPSTMDSTLPHSIVEPKNLIAHDITVAAGSRLEGVLGSAVTTEHTCRVNSRHHQSVARLGDSLVASATAPDGVIEAVEAPDEHFCVGVQWHPENFWRTGEFRALFDAFIACASEKDG